MHQAFEQQCKFSASAETKRISTRTQLFCLPETYQTGSADVVEACFGSEQNMLGMVCVMTFHTHTHTYTRVRLPCCAASHVVVDLAGAVCPGSPRSIMGRQHTLDRVADDKILDLEDRWTTKEEVRQVFMRGGNIVMCTRCFGASKRRYRTNPRFDGRTSTTLILECVITSQPKYD
jgi:hypothetical protein